MSDLAHAGARRSTDRGLSALGLIMQLVGGLMTALAAGYLMMIFVMLSSSSGGIGNGGLIVWFVAVLGASLVRSVAHSQAGAALIDETAGAPATSLSRYITLAFVQIGVVCVALLANDAKFDWVVFTVLILGAWPLALLVVASPMVKELGGRAPMASDGGLDGVSILMLLFGIIGLGTALIMMLGWLELPSPAKGKLIGLAMLVSIGLLAIRSFLHVQAGARGTTSTDANATLSAAAGYARFGSLVSVVVAVLFVLAILDAMPKGQADGTMMMLVFGAMLGGFLLAWPRALGGYVRHRQLLAISGPGGLHARSADRGLPALGWLLLAFGVFALASGLATALVGDLNGGEGGRGRDPFEALGGLLGSGQSDKLWLGIAIAGLETWAGAELVRMTPRYRTAGLVYGLAASAVALYTYLPVLDNVARQSSAVMGNPLAAAAFTSIAMSLVIPVATVFLVQRKLVDADRLASTFS